MLFVGLRNRDGVIRVAGRQREPVWHLRTLEGTVWLERGKGVFKKALLRVKMVRAGRYGGTSDMEARVRVMGFLGGEGELSRVCSDGAILHNVEDTE